MASCGWQNFGIVSNSLLNENSFSRVTNSPYFKINWMILWRCISPLMISKTLGHNRLFSQSYNSVCSHILVSSKEVGSSLYIKVIRLPACTNPELGGFAAAPEHSAEAAGSPAQQPVNVPCKPCLLCLHHPEQFGREPWAARAVLGSPWGLLWASLHLGPPKPQTSIWVPKRGYIWNIDFIIHVSW